MSRGKGRVLRGGRLVKTARGVASFAAVVGVGLVAGGAVAQELDCTSPPTGGPENSEMCDLGVLGGPDEGNWEGSYGVAYGISGDGRVVVGRALSDSGDVAFRWTDQEGMLNLSTIEGIYGTAFATNADGSVIVGDLSREDGPRAFRWTEDSGAVDLGTLPGGEDSHAVAVNADGSTIVGYSTIGGDYRAFRWTENGGLENLGTLGDSSISHGVSDDGTIVVGSTTGPYEINWIYWQAFRWVEGEGMEFLVNLPGGDSARAYGVSGNGEIAVGFATVDSEMHAVRWVESNQVQDIGTLTGSSGYSVANATNGDGTVVVGHSSIAEGGVHAFRWTEDGTEGVNDNLEMQDLGTLSGAFESYARDVSDDGTIVVGDSGGRAFIWREAGGGMEDYSNLTLSFPVLANDSAVALAQSQFALGEVMDQTVFAAQGQMVMNARAGLLHTERNPTHVGQRDTSLAALSFGYGVSDKVTLGASLGLHGTSLKNNAFDMGTGRNIALWGLYSEGGAGRTGLQFSASLGYGTSEGEIARGRLLADVILATGSSKVTTRAVEASLGYGFEQESGWLLTPSVTLAHFDTTRAGYAEAGAAFNAAYNPMEFSRTELTLAIEGEVKLGASGRLRIGGGIEQELNPEKPRLSGTTDLPALPTFDIEGDFVPNKTRPFVTAGYTHDFGNGSSVTADLKIGRAVYGNSPDVGVGIGYGWKF